MEDESEVVLVKRKIDGKFAPVRMDKAKYDANPKAYELWDEKAKAPAGDDDDDADDNTDTGHGLKVKGEGKGAEKLWLVIDKEKKQVGTEKYKTKADAQAFIDLMHPPKAA